MKSPIRIAVLDSGVNLRLSTFYGKKIYGLKVSETENGFQVENSVVDENGHGTQIIHIILSRLKEDIDYEIYSIQILNQELKCSIQKLCYALEFIDSSLHVDFINLSLGFHHASLKVENVLYKLLYKNVYIISAFDNNGMDSYPACCSGVIGVKGAALASYGDFLYDEQENVVTASDMPVTVMSNSGTWERTVGTSFVCANVTSMAVNMLWRRNRKASLSEQFKAEAKAEAVLRRPCQHKKMERVLLFPMESVPLNHLDRLTQFSEIAGVLSLHKCVLNELRVQTSTGVHLIPVYSDFLEITSLHIDCIYVSDLNFLPIEEQFKLYKKLFDTAALMNCNLSCREKLLDNNLEAYRVKKGVISQRYEFRGILLP